MRNLHHAAALYAKALLFLALGILSAVLLLEDPTLKKVLLLGLCIWAFCRAYYFAFYVIEKYVDSQYRYSGLMSLIKYWFRGRRS
jgi:hypothetical protein